MIVGRAAASIGSSAPTSMPGLRGQLVHLVRPERARELVRVDRLVRAGADPGLHLVAEAAIAELLDEAVEPALAAEEAAERPGDVARAAGPAVSPPSEPSILPRSSIA